MLKRLIKIVLTLALLLGIAVVILPIRISPKYIDNEVLQNPEVFTAFESPGVVVTPTRKVPLKGIILSRPPESFSLLQLTRVTNEQSLIEVDAEAGRAFYKWRKSFGGCGNTGSILSQLPRKHVLKNEKRDLGLHLVEHFYAFPSPETVGANDSYSQELIRSFLKTAEFRKTEYGDLNRPLAKEFISRLLPTLEERDYYSALWFYGSIYPERLDALAREQIEADLQVAGRGDAYHYLKYIDYHSPEDYLDYVHRVQLNLGNQYASDHEFYAEILLKAGDWRGVNFIMNKMKANQNRYFTNGFRMTGDLCWPIARAALDEHEGEFEDHNAINPYIGNWYFKNRTRISYTNQRIRVEGSQLTHLIEGTRAIESE